MSGFVLVKQSTLDRVGISRFDFQMLVTLFLFCLVWLACTRENEMVLIKVIFRKIRVWWESIFFMILSKDQKGLGIKYCDAKYNTDPNGVLQKGLDKTSVKRIVFLRHGESDWNNVFNKGFGPGILVRLVKALLTEASMIFRLDSPFLDSPLNMEGIEQALELSRFLDEKEHPEADDAMMEMLQVVRGDSGSSIIVSSSLRRAIATTTLGMWPRLERSGEKIHILSCLQEISRNVDTRALSEKKTVADLPFSRIAPHCGGDAFSPDLVYDASENFGNKSLALTGKMRLDKFSEWVFERSEDTIIVGGHSLWFKYFFQMYLPFATKHEAKDKKISNSGVVCFNLHKDESGGLCAIDPESIKVLYGGFTSK